jgi:hypothetical protein
MKSMLIMAGVLLLTGVQHLLVVLWLRKRGRKAA